MNRRRGNRVFKAVVSSAVGFSMTLLFFLLGVIIYKGMGAIDTEFICSPSRDFGASGGILYQIIGSILLVVTAALVSFPIALGTAIFKSEYLSGQRAQRLSNILLYALNGIPSIIFGIFGLVFFVNVLGMGISWFVGALILAMMILPTITLSAYQSINSIPTNYRESALVLGLSKWQVVTKVLLPQGISGGITGLLIGMARAVGETAPIMFIATAFSGVTVPHSLVEPVLTLPTHILALTQQASSPQALENAWGASFVLIIIVMLFSLTALYIRLKQKSNSLR